MELIALAVLFALGFFPLLLATELAAGHPDTARQVFGPSVDASTAQGLLATPSSGARLPTAAANDENERQAA